MMLKKNEDAYGEEILAYLHGSRSPEIVERDDGYMDTSYGAAHYFSPYESWMPIEKKGMKFVRDQVLDIGCGAGRVVHYLEGRGHEVLGIDNSPGAIKACHTLGIKNTRVLSITQINEQLGHFDTIVMYGNNFGLFGSFKRAQWLLKKMYRMTSDRGRIVACTTDPYQTNLPEHKEYHRINKKKGRMCGQLRIRIRFKKIKGAYFDYLLVSPRELEKILAGTGWEINRLIRSDSPTYMAIIDKI